MSASASNSETSSRKLQIPHLGSVLDLVPCLGSDKPALVVMTLNQLYDIVTTPHWQHWQHEVLEANAIPELTRLLQSNNITIAKTAVCSLSIDLAWKCGSWIMDYQVQG
jgi:hypothetical protein